MIINAHLRYGVFDANLDPPNQALEPTPTSVTIPAGAGLAPAVVVAHL